MCLGVQHIHTECNHARKFYILSPCDSANDGVCTNFTTVYTIKVTAPALCLGCFRRKEAAIDAEYENLVGDLRDEIARVDEWFAKGIVRDEEAVRRLRVYRVECRSDIIHAKAAWDERVRMFREEQGVWGDG